MMKALLIPLLAAATLPAQDDGLEIVDARPTYGHLGPERPKTGVLAGEIFHFAFNIKGMKQDENGKANYSLLVEVLDSKGNTAFKLGPRNATAINYLGGDLFPCAAHLSITLDTHPGDYSMRVTIEDREAKKKAVFNAKGKILQPEFGLIHVGLTSDRDGFDPTPPVGTIGETLYVNFGAVNFQRDKKTKQPDISVSMRIFDDKGKPTFAKPLSGRANKGILESFKVIPMQFGLTMNRVGRFTVELTAKDELSGKTSTVKFPIRVVSLQD